MNIHNSMTPIGEMTHFACLGERDLVLYPVGLNEVSSEHLELALKVGSALLGKYKIVKVLDVNQFGFVYFVEKNISNKKRFIVKEFFPPRYVKRGARDERIVKSSLSLDDMVHYNYMKEIFTAEADNLAAIMQNPHKNIVQPISVEKNRNNTIYIVFEEEEGILLQKYLKDKKETLNNAEILHMAKDILNALEHLHSLGIYHLDIKPAKIMIKDDATPILSGFEASGVYYDEGNGIFCGGYTPVYAAPERINNIPKVNQRRDIYSMGAVIYQMITGVPPAIASGQMSEYGRKNEYDSLTHKDFLGKYDIPLLVAVDKALSYDINERFSDANSFKRAISGLPPLEVRKEKKRMQYLVVVGIFLISTLGYFIFDKDEVIEDRIATNEIKHIENLPQKKTLAVKDYEVNRSVDGNIYAQALDKKIVNEEAYEEIAEDKSLKNKKKLTSIKNDLHSKELKRAIEEKSICEVNVTIHVSLSEIMGKTEVMVNGSVIENGRLLVKEGEVYRIKIHNPYFQDLEFKRTFKEMSAFPEQKFSLKSGKSKIYIDGLPNNTIIKAYRHSVNEDPVEIDVQIIYRDDSYEMLLKSGNNRYLTFEHKEYKPYKTKIFLVESGEAITQVHTMTKKIEEVKNEFIEKLFLNINREKEHKKPKIKKSKEVKKELIRQTIGNSTKEVKLVKIKKIPKGKKESTKLSSGNIKKKVKPKKYVKKKNKKIRTKKQVVKKSVTKKRKSSKNRTKKRSSSRVWYCKTVGAQGSIGARGATEQMAKNTAMRLCRNKAKRGRVCKILNCFLMR